MRHHVLLFSAVFAFTIGTTSAAEPAVQRDIPYVTNGTPRQTLDLYLPAEKFKRPLPLIVWIHGGAWKMGSKDWITVKYLLDDGYAIASIAYRFSQEAIFPAQIQDCNAALNFLIANAEKYQLDPKRIVVSGGSAGGHLALLLGLARDEKDWGADPAFRPRAIVDFFGVSDINTAKKGITNPEKIADIDSIYVQLLGALPADQPDLAKAASPMTYVTAKAPPVLAIHGGKDDTVPVDQSKALLKQLTALHVSNKLFVFAKAGHDGPDFQDPQVQREVRSFLKRILATPAKP